MKTKLKLLALFIALFSILSCSNHQSSLKSFGLNGKVKSCLEKHYSAEKKFGEWQAGDENEYAHNRSGFDQDGNHLWTEYLDNDGKLEAKEKSIYENGELIESEFYYEDGELLSKTKYLKSSENELEFVSYDANGKTKSKGISYFKNGRVIKSSVTIFENDEIKNELTQIFEYDKHNNLIVQKRTDNKGAIQHSAKFEYLTFDNKNNWLKRLEYNFESEEPKNIVIREIEYY